MDWAAWKRVATVLTLTSPLIPIFWNVFQGRKNTPDPKEAAEAAEKLSITDVNSTSRPKAEKNNSLQKWETEDTDVLKAIYRAAKFISLNRSKMISPSLSETLAKRVLGSSASIVDRKLKVEIPETERNPVRDYITSFVLFSVPAAFLARALFSWSVLASITVIISALVIAFIYPSKFRRVSIDLDNQKVTSNAITEPLLWLGLETLWVRQKIENGQLKLFVNHVPIVSRSLDQMDLTEKQEFSDFYRILSLNIIDNPMIAPGVMVLYEHQFDEGLPINVTQPKPD